LISARDMNTITRRHGKAINAIARMYFELYGLKIVNKAILYAKKMLQKDELSPVSSGIVIGGFGEAEVFPSVLSHPLIFRRVRMSR